MNKDHTAFTHVLFEDALIGLGCRFGRTQLREKSLDELQRLYADMKKAEIAHAN